MKLLTTIKELQDVRKELSSSTIGFVPTMGALHEGHISLIKKSKNENNITIVSIFVNPTQFLQGEDLSKYPRNDKKDIEICKLCKVDFLFMPQISTMYGQNELSIKAPNIQSYILEGYKRPTHFDGVLQIVLKLFNLVQPTNAYFGKKDAQQLSLITQMVEDLFLSVNIVPCEIIREADGLALSSRNVYLNEAQRIEALKISKSLKRAANLIGNGELTCKVLKKEIENILYPNEIEYISFVNKNFKQIEKIVIGDCIILVAMRLEQTRLIDNIWI